MKDYLNSSIKEVITAFPEVGKILEEYQIGCVSCAVGSCLLKDVLEIHRLPDEVGQEMLARVAKVIYPDREIELPPIAHKPPSDRPKITYSPPVKKLVDEHQLIKKWIGFIPVFLSDFDLESPEDRQIVLEGVYFIRNYADKFHHAKEEEILFKYFDENTDILKVMLEDHVNARAHARAIEEGVLRRDTQQVTEHLNAYRDLLKEHIRKEDEILFPWMEKKLSTREVGELFLKFGEAEDRIEKESVDRCIQFIRALEERVQSTSKEVLS